MGVAYTNTVDNRLKNHARALLLKLCTFSSKYAFKKKQSYQLMQLAAN